jgi:hypothetical protein
VICGGRDIYARRDIYGRRAPGRGALAEGRLSEKNLLKEGRFIGRCSLGDALLKKWSCLKGSPAG